MEYFSGHHLPRSSLRGLGIDWSVHLSDRLTFILGYGYGVDAPRGNSFGGHELNVALEWEFLPPTPH